MKFYDVVKELQKDNKGYIVLVRCGIFFTAIGKDAVILQSLFGLAPVCIKKNVCKCGFPVIKVNKFINKFKENGYSYVIYDYSKDGFGSTGKQFKELLKIDGKQKLI